MKQINAYFNTIIAVALLLFTMIATTAKAQLISEGMATKGDTLKSEADAIDISLLTVGPGKEVWSLYGHTAIRFQNHLNDTDVAINYGSFSFDQPFFILRFVFGLTDYEMAIVPMKYFLGEYKEEQRWVVEQKLNLTSTEKKQIAQALQQNALPKNVTYRYNFFYDNCTTRAYNIIIKNLNRRLQTSNNQEENNNYRTMIHQWTNNHRWTRFGNDILLGIKADFKTKPEAALFLPDSTRKCFDSTYIIDNNDIKQKLVSSKVWLLQPSCATDSTSTDIITPTMVFAFIFVIVILLTLLQWKKKNTLWILDAALLFTSGLAGIILFIMIFSQHPTVQINFQILILNPLSLLFLYPTMRNEIQEKKCFYWKILAACVIIFLIGGFWQSYAEGMYFVALTLLVRSITNIRYEK